MTAPAGYQELLSTIADGFVALPDKPEETPDSTLNALWSLAMGEPVSAAAALGKTLRNLTADESTLLKTYIARWDAGEPLAHITGRQRFFDIELIAGPQALVPRKETEILAQCALDKISQACVSRTDESPVVIDVCCGCGNLALTYARHFPMARIYAADLSEEAVALACQNAQFSGAGSNVTFVSGDLFVPFSAFDLRQKVDVLSCNPPYISTKKVGEMAEEIALYEPSMAFDGGPFGIAILQRMLKEAPGYLKAGGWLLFEIGAGQGPSLVKLLTRNSEFDAVESRCDEAGEIRAIAARKAEKGIQA